MVIRVKSSAAHTKTVETDTLCLSLLMKTTLFSKTGRSLRPHTTHACAHAPLVAPRQMRRRYRARTLSAEVHGGIGKILTGIGKVLKVLAVITVVIPRNDDAMWTFQ